MSKIKQKASSKPSFLNQVKSRPPGYFFKKLDSYNVPIHVGKFQLFQLNLFRDDAKLRKAIFPLIIAACILWIAQGWDSDVEQIEHFLFYLPSFMLGRITWSQISFYYFDSYGKFVHYSAFVIYMLFFIGISKYLHDKLDVVNSQNIIASVSFVALSVGLFEYYWMISYYFLQNQPWILSFQWPQIRILLQNIFMIFIGLLFLVSIDWKVYKLNLNDWTTYVLLNLTFGFMVLWWMYGNLLPIQQISVQVIGYGTWTSSKFFPQTVYTVETNVLDNISAGEQFWIQNDLLHLVNTLTKVFMTLTLYSILKLKKK